MSRQSYPHLAARIFNCPLLIHPQKLDAIIAGLGSRLLGGAEICDNSFAGRFGAALDLVDERLDAARAAIPAVLEALPAEAFSTKRGPRPQDRAYQVIDGVAVINVNGALVHKSRMDGASSFLLGYNTIAADLEHAQANADAHAILLVFDSPGGEVQGAFEAANRISATRGGKPIYAIADGMAASAAYLLASACERIAVSPTGYVGSIGVVMRHADFSRAMDREGVTVTHIYAGAHKVDGHQFAPLTDAVRADFQREIDGYYTEFVNAVAENMPLLTPEAIRATEARTYRGAEAVAAGLAHRVATTDQMIAELAALRSARSIGRPARATANDKEKTMSGNTPEAGHEQQPVLTQADLDAARAEGIAEGRKAGAAAERERIQAVEAQALPGHESLIAALKFDGKTTGPEAAVQVLQAERSRATQRAADLAADAPEPVGFDADNGIGAESVAVKQDPRTLATAIANKQAEAAARGQTLSASQALQLVKQEAANG